MKKIITAIGNPNLNELLKKEKEIEVIGNDIQYQDGIFEILEKNLNVEFLILNEFLKEEISLEELIKKIKNINKKLKIIIILEEPNQELEKILILEGVFKIFYNNQINIKQLIDFLLKEETNEKEDLKKEIEYLKEIITENKQNNFKKENIENIKKSQIISICGPSGVGKSIVTVNLAKAMTYQKQKILIIDFDILNNSLHTILGVKKIPQKLNNYFLIEKIIVKINKKIDLISATDFLFIENNKKININQIEEILEKLKEKYELILIDTSSECFFDFTKFIINYSDKNIFITETNILEIKKSKELLRIYINEWKANKNKFYILFNKYDKDSISIPLLKSLFADFKIIRDIKILFLL